MKEVIIEIPKLVDGKVQVDAEGNEVMEKHSVVMKRISYGEKVDLENETVDIQIYGGNPITKVNTAKLRTLSLLKSIVKSDVPLNTQEQIRNLPIEAGELLFEAYTELNSIENKKKI